MGCSCARSCLPFLVRKKAKDAISMLDDPCASLPPPLRRCPIYPPELVLQDVTEYKQEQIIAQVRAEPKTRGLDLFTQLLIAQILNPSDGISSGTADDGFPNCQLDKVKSVGYSFPDFYEDASNAHEFDNFRKRFLARLKLRLLLFALDEALPFYDDAQPTFFDSLEEAAVYFDIVCRPLFDVDVGSRTATDGRVCKRKHLDGDVSAMAFSGFAQWWLRGVQGSGEDADWPDRHAPKSCQPPAGTVAVIDLCKMADYEVRKGYLPYGAAVFFGAQRKVLGVFIPKPSSSSFGSGEMFLPPKKNAWDFFGGCMTLPPDSGVHEAASDAWDFALWRFKCSLYWLTFGVYHLVHCHWITSNSLVTATREVLPPSHSVRKLVWPFLHNAISVNFAAGIKLTSKQGALTRVPSQTFASAMEMLEWLTSTWRYETFEEQLARTKLPREVLDTMPMVRDGRRLWHLISCFVCDYLKVFYLTSDYDRCANTYQKRISPADDLELVAFWEAADTAAIQSRRLGLPQPLTFGALADYLTHAMFTCTGVHELLGNIVVDMMLPTTASPRILEARFFGSRGGGRPPQSTVQDYFRMVGISASVANVKMPMLISEIDRVAGEWAQHANMPRDQREKVTSIYLKFANELKLLAKDIDKINSKCDAPFASFNPRVLDCSVSL